MATPALASGTTAGTLIANTASASYTSGGTTATISSNTVTVKVDQLLNVAVASLTSTPVAASSTAAILTYQVTNSGNGTDTFNLTADPSISGNPFTGVIQKVAIDTNGNGTYDPGVDQIITNGSASPTIAADGAIKVFVLVDLPSGAVDGAVSQVKLTGASVIGTGSPGTLFAGAGVGGVDAIVGATTAQSNALASLVASLAQVTLTKTAVITDPFGGSTPVPGAIITYSLVSHANGTGTAAAMHVIDAIPSNTTYQAGTVTLNGTTLTDAVDADAGTGGASGIDVTLGNVVGGSPDKTVTFKVKIN
jgi:uncharacterized repeat protein (TIGR01451 family)